MPITTLPTPPSRADAANFSSRADAFFAALPNFVAEFNALVPVAVAGSVTGSLTVSGNVGIGGASASIPLNVIDAQSTSGTHALSVKVGAYPTEQAFAVRSDSFVQLESTYAHNTSGASANVVIGLGGYLYRATSSRKYKREITDMAHGLAEVLALRPVTFQCLGKQDSNTIYGGLIAEEVHAAGLTEFVEYGTDKEPDALHYGNMVALAFKAIQEQQSLIVVLTARIAALEPAAA